MSGTKRVGSFEIGSKVDLNTIGITNNNKVFAKSNKAIYADGIDCNEASDVLILPDKEKGKKVARVIRKTASK